MITGRCVRRLVPRLVCKRVFAGNYMKSVPFDRGQDIAPRKKTALTTLRHRRS